MNDDSFFNTDTDSQFVLSYELICLLRHLMIYDAQKLKKIVDGALASGLQDELKKKEIINDSSSLEEIQENLIDFFAMLETMLIEAVNERAMQKALEKDLFPAIDQIDSTVCDDETVQCSVEKATSNIDQNPHENPKDLLFKELLRRWKPDKKNVLN